MSAAALPVPVAKFAGLPLSKWAFGLRNWIAMMLALYAAFWLQLEGAQSAAVCVGILSLPTRGQVIDKAVYRIVGTVVGVAMSIVIAGAFNEIRELFIVASAAWLAGCVYVAGLQDGSRAYGSALSGYTVALVAVAQIDNPSDVFSAGINRGAAIVIGVLAITLVNDVLAAPDVLPNLVARLRKAQTDVRKFAVRSLRTGTVDEMEAASLLRAVTATHPDIMALPGESPKGRARSAGAGAAALSMIRQIEAVRTIIDHAPDVTFADTTLRSRLCETLEGGGDSGRTPHLEPEARRLLPIREPGERLAVSCAGRILQEDVETENALGILEGGRGSVAIPPMRIYRSRRVARRNALRAFLTVSIAGCGFALVGWPELSFSLVLVAVLVALASNNPKPDAFATVAVIALPIVSVVAGVTQFVVLDGADEFELLALAMLPVVVGGSLLVVSGKPALGGIGFLLLVFFPLLLALTNPQRYDPEQFLLTSLLAILAGLATFVLVSVVFPTSDRQRRRWLLSSAQSDLERAIAGVRASTLEEFRDADRIGQFVALADETSDVAKELDRLMWLTSLTAAIRRLRPLLDTAGDGLGTIRSPLADLDADGLRRAAERILGAARETALSEQAQQAAVEAAIVASLMRRREGFRGEKRISAE